MERRVAAVYTTWAGLGLRGVALGPFPGRLVVDLLLGEVLLGYAPDERVLCSPATGSAGERRARGAGCLWRRREVGAVSLGEEGERLTRVAVSE